MVYNLRRNQLKIDNGLETQMMLQVSHLLSYKKKGKYYGVLCMVHNFTQKSIEN